MDKKQMISENIGGEVKKGLNIIRAVDQSNIILQEEPFNIYDILKHLARATRILLYEKDYDGEGYEIMETCVKRAEQLIKEVA